MWDKIIVPLLTLPIFFIPHLLFTNYAQEFSRTEYKNASKYGRGNKLGIIYGMAVEKDADFPFQLKLYRNGEFYCGAVIIGERIGLTAAHCVWENQNPGDYHVVAGNKNLISQNLSTNYKDIEDGSWERVEEGEGHEQRRQLTRLNIHPGYAGRGTTWYDIALFFVDKNFVFDKWVNKIRIPQPPHDHHPPFSSKIQSSSSNNYAGLEALQNLKDGTVMMTGWGLTQSNVTTLPEVLQKVQVSVTDCLFYISMGNTDPIQDSVICAGGWTSNKNAGHGDSGGPLFIKFKESASPLLIGIINQGHGDPFTPGKDPAVAANVSFLAQWIHDTSHNYTGVDQELIDLHRELFREKEWDSEIGDLGSKSGFLPRFRSFLYRAQLGFNTMEEVDEENRWVLGNLCTATLATIVACEATAENFSLVLNTPGYLKDLLGNILDLATENRLDQQTQTIEAQTLEYSYQIEEKLLKTNKFLNWALLPEIERVQREIGAKIFNLVQDKTKEMEIKDEVTLRGLMTMNTILGDLYIAAQALAFLGPHGKTAISILDPGIELFPDLESEFPTLTDSDQNQVADRLNQSTLAWLHDYNVLLEDAEKILDEVKEPQVTVGLSNLTTMVVLLQLEIEFNWYSPKKLLKKKEISPLDPAALISFISTLQFVKSSVRSVEEMVQSLLKDQDAHKMFTPGETKEQYTQVLEKVRGLTTLAKAGMDVYLKYRPKDDDTKEDEEKREIVVKLIADCLDDEEGELLKGQQQKI